MQLHLTTDIKNTSIVNVKVSLFIQVNNVYIPPLTCLLGLYFTRCQNKSNGVEIDSSKFLMVRLHIISQHNTQLIEIERKENRKTFIDHHDKFSLTSNIASSSILIFRPHISKTSSLTLLAKLLESTRSP